MVDPRTIQDIKNMSDHEKNVNSYVFVKLVEHLEKQLDEAKNNPKYRQGDSGNKRDARRELFRLQVALRYIKNHTQQADDYLKKNSKKS